MKNILVSLLLASTLLPVHAQTELLYEDFSSESLPPGWSNDSLGQVAMYAWRFDNPGSRSIPGAGFDTSFVILDSDHYGALAQQSVSLTTAATTTLTIRRVDNEPAPPRVP